MAFRQLKDLPPGKFVFAASTGGHLAQLVRLSERLEAHDNSLWITSESAQSRALLEGRRVQYMPYVAPRDARRSARVFARARAIMTGEPFDMAISTGAALGASVLAAASWCGIPTRYIESISRVHGPSLAGRLLAASGRHAMFTQHKEWASHRWLREEPVLDQYRRVTQNTIVPESPRIFVTLGTIAPYRFDALVDQLLTSGIATSDTVWQLGATQRTGLPGTTYDMLSSDEFDRHAEEADVVISHAGVGTILRLLEQGRSPIVVPRLSARGEHVDDHQMQIFQLLRDRDLAVTRLVEEIDRSALEHAMQWGTLRVAHTA